MTGVFRGLNESVLSELECPVCTEYMIPPITLCVNGHNVCHNCRSKMDKCPSCRSAFLDTRNVSLENIARLQKYPCRNRHVGCNAALSMELIEEHQMGCAFAAYKCPVNNIPGINCSWEGTPKNFKSHIRKVHREYVIESNSISCGTGTRAAVWFAMSEIFLNYQCVQGNKWYSAVQHVVTSNTDLRFKCRYKLRADDGIEELTETHKVHSWKQDFQSIFKCGRCFRHDDEVIKCFLKDEELDLTLDIIKIE